ncbi:MAG: AMP-binding protein [Candidatus Malihini olakiniferum]
MANANANANANTGIERGSIVAVLLPNIPEMIEAHFASRWQAQCSIPLNSRLYASSLLFMLRHCNAKMLIVDTEFYDVIRYIMQELPELPLIKVTDKYRPDPRVFSGAIEYEQFLGAANEPIWTSPPMTNGTLSP